jgi:hypothetical protein
LGPTRSDPVSFTITLGDSHPARQFHAEAHYGI